MFRCYCKSIASGTYDTLALKIIFSATVSLIVSAFLFILSYFLSSELTKSLTKLNNGISLSFYNPFQFETQKYYHHGEKRKQIFAITMVL